MLSRRGDFSVFSLEREGCKVMKEEFARKSVEKFVGCDSDEIGAGSKESPSIWMFGLEHGTYKSINEDSFVSESEELDNNYSIETQKKWPYNKKAFKLLAAMHKDYEVENWLEFANKYQPFVKGQEGFFKGNLYPFPCKSVKDWPQKAIDATGCNTKKEYLDWCEGNRLPAINSWVNEYQPKIIIGVGLGNKQDFSLAVFKNSVAFREFTFLVNGHNKRLLYFVGGNRKLVVVPHFSGVNGLNSDESLQVAGEFISGVIDGSGFD